MPDSVSFGIIVLNGEPYTRYCIRSLYPFARQIIVVEGACEGSRHIATPAGHSTDGTLDVLQKIKAEEDPENKILLVTAEDEGHPDGFWPGEKDEQSRAYAKRATGNFIWQVDIDEFYRPDDMKKILQLLQTDPSISALSFKQFQFWGGFSYYVDSWYFKRNLPDIHRIFAWKPGYTYVTHRPPTVRNNEGTDLRSLHWLDARKTSKMGIFMYHYSFVLPKQAAEKAEYYSSSKWLRLDAHSWYEKNFQQISNPFKVFINSSNPGWLVRFRGEHPPVIAQLQQDLKNGTLRYALRDTEDIEKMMRSWKFITGRFLLKAVEDPYIIFMNYRKSFRRKIKRILHPQSNG